jgi:hypothetical protein
VLAAAPVGVSFNETLTGFGIEGGNENDTIADFEAGYAAGKKLNQTLEFGLYVSIPDLSIFLKDPERRGVCQGYAESTGLTPDTGAPVEAGGRINIFDGGVLPTHELRMEYTLPFVALDGLNYTLTGVKHIPSYDCKQLPSQVTTLYVHVREGYDNPQGKIVRMGVVKIGPVATVKLIASLKLFGGNDITELGGLVNFGLFLGQNVLTNCDPDPGPTTTDFYYFWLSDQHSAALVGMIKRPTENRLELRLIQAQHGQTPVVKKQNLSLSQYQNFSDGTIIMGPLKMSKSGVVGTVDGVSINLPFTSLDGRSNLFLPPSITSDKEIEWLRQYVPAVQSAYGGAVTSGAATVGDYSFASGSIVKTQYPIPLALGIVKWAMLSANEFDGSDLQIEVVATPVTDLGELIPVVKRVLDCNLEDCYIAPSYVRLHNRQYHLNNLVSEQVRVEKASTFNANQTAREFSVKIHLLEADTTLEVNCTAPVDSFAFVEKEGATYIHTTLMADCVAAINAPLHKPQVVYSRGRNLMELKA